MRDTWQVPGYDLLPKLASLKMPALVIAGDHDVIPVEAVAHIAQALPSATLVTLKNCGHFSYMECSAGVRQALDDFFRTR
jgi:proline iminopeptidase